MKTQSGHQIDSSLCPSAPAQEGAVLLTVVGFDGETGYIPDLIHITAEFLAEADPTFLEQRFRFASPCLHNSCAQWSQNECSLPAKLVELVAVDELAQPPRCAIRKDCRWYSQTGFAACRRCPIVTRTAES